MPVGAAFATGAPLARAGCLGRGTACLASQRLRLVQRFLNRLVRFLQRGARGGPPDALAREPRLVDLDVAGQDDNLGLLNLLRRQLVLRAHRALGLHPDGMAQPACGLGEGLGRHEGVGDACRAGGHGHDLLSGGSRGLGGRSGGGAAFAGRHGERLRLTLGAGQKGLGIGERLGDRPLVDALAGEPREIDVRAHRGDDEVRGAHLRRIGEREWLELAVHFHPRCPTAPLGGALQGPGRQEGRGHTAGAGRDDEDVHPCISPLLGFRTRVWVWSESKSAALGSPTPTWRTDSAARAVAKRRVRSLGQPDRRPCSVPASSVSPAPTVLSTATRGGVASRALPRWAQSTPSEPAETSTSSMPSALSRSAAWRRASGVSSGWPAHPASSFSLGLMPVGRAARPEVSAGPLVSSQTETPRSRIAVMRLASWAGVTLGGRLPEMTTASCPERRVPTRAFSASSACPGIRRPGPFRSVTRPPASETFALMRVSPGTRMKASLIPHSEKAFTNACSLSAPSRPETVTSCPSFARTRATLMPLPAASSRVLSVRLTSPSWSAPRRIARSRAGFRVSVRMRAIRQPPGLRAPRRRWIGAAPARPAPGPVSGSVRESGPSPWARCGC
ncbi:hypothetical protein STIAU_6769 [Stigmatella aurantiaca DW4/3-1]|uniref:Uncharacterized protein n=1 Tax=Stigmatella aurantiaca (strain DW4/3-1) TaxID=378806 RepID=Q08XD6_STIAD|nr:hypothetical protein STIAU_6769 [Stigmatella aurantiaca DW4/3-1]